MKYSKHTSSTLFLSTSLLALLTTAAPTAEKRHGHEGGMPVPVVSVHQHETDCAHAPALSCGWGYPQFSTKTSPHPCSGLLSTNLAIPCGSCVELTCNGKSTHVRMISTAGSAFDISYTNYLEIASPGDYALSYAGRSGAGTNPLSGCAYNIVDVASCDTIIPGDSNAPMPTGGHHAAPPATAYGASPSTVSASTSAALYK